MTTPGGPNARAPQPRGPRPVRRRAPLWLHLLGMTLAAVLPLAVFAAVAVLMDARNDRDAMAARMTEKAAQVAAGVDAELQRTIAMLEVIGRSGSLLRGDLREFHAFATRLVQAEPKWSNMQLLGPAGEHLVNARMPFDTALPPLLRPDLAVAAARAGRPVVSDLVPGVVAQRDLTAVYVPIALGGESRYVLVAALEPENWQKLLESRMPPDIEAVLLDRGSLVITSTGPADRVRGAQPLRASFVRTGEQLLLGSRPVTGGVRSEMIGGVPVYVATSLASVSGWTVGTVAPKGQVDRRLHGSAASLGAGLAALLIAGLLAAAMVSRKLSRSILSLVEGVQAVAAGRVPQPHQDSVSEVHQAREALLRTAEASAEQLRREAMLRERLEAHEAARNAFLAVLGHELRNPLAPLRNVANILSRAEAGSEQVRKAASILHRQTTQLARLVDDLLDVTRVQNGKVELRKEVVDLTQLVRHVGADHEAAAQEAQIELTLQAPPGPVPVWGDPARLTQVIGNLLHNAFKFTPPMGSVRVRLERLQDTVRVSVEDSGAGMDRETLQKIFEPFMQGPQDGARAHGGLGLGLALVNALVRMHGGVVSATSDGPGRGSVFRVDLPLLATDS